MTRSLAGRWAIPLSLAMALSGLATVASSAVPSPAVAQDSDSPGAPTGPVEVPEYTTETSQVFALPDGRFHLVSHQQPVRVERGDDWVPIDTTLVQGSDGTWAPRATTVPITLSGGGDDAPLLTMGDEGAQVAMQWHGDLPTPTVDGASLTYEDVRPGVDLVMTAEPSGYSQVFVVEDAQAAQALAQEPAALTLQGDGLAVSKSADGSVSAANDEVSFVGAPPMQWDSSGFVGAPGTAEETGTSEIRHVAATYDRIDDETLKVTVAPPAATLNDASTTYPIYVDPKMSESGQPHTMTVHSGGWNYYDDPSEPLRVGYCGWSGCTSSQGNSRSYFSFDISALVGTGADPHIDAASVQVYQLWNASSSATAVNLKKAGSFTRSTDYNDGVPGAQLQQISSSAGAGGNNEGWLSFTNANVDDYVHDVAAADGTGVIRFALVAPAENDKYLWKKFGNTSTYNPTIDIVYAFAPTVPAGLTLEDAVNCTGETTRTTDRYLGLMAKSVDQNPTPLNTQHHFEVWSSTDGVTGINTATDTRVRYNTAQSSETNVPSGTWGKFHSNSTNSSNQAALPDGGYFFRDRAHSDGSYSAAQYSAWSGFKAFYVDTTPPQVPTVASHDYPRDQWGASQLSRGTFAVTSNTDAVGFSYAFDNSSTPTVTGCDYTVDNGTTGYVPSSAGNGVITAPATLTAGVAHTLTVRSFDRAHIMSGNSITYTFYVPLSVPGVAESDAFRDFPKFRYEPELADSNGMVATGNGAQYLTTLSDPSDSGGQEVVLTPPAQPAPTPTAPAVLSYSLPVPLTNSYYALGIDFNQLPDGGQARFRVAYQNQDELVTDETSQTLTVDTYSATKAEKFVSLGGVANTGSVKVTIEVTGKNAASAGYSISIDKIHLVPLRAKVSGTLSDTFDNTGIGLDGASIHAQLTAEQEQALSNTSLGLVGLGRGTADANGGTATVGGVTFTMPRTRTLPDGRIADNVISAGQEIQLPAGTPVPYSTNNGAKVLGHVNLLVASTCKAINPDPTDKTHALTIKYSGGTEVTTGDVTMVKIPKWLDPRDTSVPGVTLDRYLQGSTPVTAPQPSLYVARFAVHAAYADGLHTIETITLPRIGTDMKPTCATAALHVFAMTLTND